MIVQKLSISEVNQFLACPWSWYYLYPMKLKLKKSPELFFGSTIHEGLAAFYTGKDPIRTAYDFIRHATWEKPPGTNEDEVFAEAERLLTLYLKKGPYFEPLDGWVEQRKSAELIHPLTKNALPVTFTFKIDLITKDGYIADHKTARSVSKHQTEPNRHQAIAYYMAYRFLFGKRPKGFIQNIIVKQKKNPRIVPQVYTYSEDDEAYLFDLIDYMIQIIEKDQWRNTAPLMRSYYPCPVGPLCPIHG